MIFKTERSAALLLVGLIASGALLVTTAFAKPPKASKKPKPAKSTKPTAAQIAAGKKIYAANGCSGCHVIDGKGGNSGPVLTKVAADSKHTPKWLEVAVTHPKDHNPNSAMPGYDSIKGKDLANLVAYLSSLK